MLIEGFLEHREVPLGATRAIVLFRIIAAFRSSTGFHVIILNELCILFIHAEIGQVNELLAKLIWVIGILLGCKSDQTIGVNVNFERVETRHKHVDTQIILEAIY